MALTLISRRARTVGFSGEITTAPNPTLNLTGDFAGTNSVRFTLTPGVWHIRADFDGDGTFRLRDRNGKDITPLVDHLDRVIGVSDESEFYFFVSNWASNVGRKLHVMLTQAPPPA